MSSASLMKDDETLVGNSQLLALMVHNAVGGELYAIQTEKKYPSAYSDTVILVYPVWWGMIPRAVGSFLQKGDWEGKTIYPLATHGGSGAGSSVGDMGWKKV